MIHEFLQFLSRFNTKHDKSHVGLVIDCGFLVRKRWNRALSAYPTVLPGSTAIYDALAVPKTEEQVPTKLYMPHELPPQIIVRPEIPPALAAPTKPTLATDYLLFSEGNYCGNDST